MNHFTVPLAIHVVSADSKNKTSRRSPHIPACPWHQDTRVVADWVAQTAWPFRQKSGMLHRIFSVLPGWRAFDTAKSRHVLVPVNRNMPALALSAGRREGQRPGASPHDGPA